MEYLLDTANVEEIKKGIAIFPITGVTTNPTILSKEKRPFWGIIQELVEVIGNRQLHVQTLGTTAEDIITEARFLREKLSVDLYVKIPVFPEGLKAMKVLSAEGINITATGIITANQAFLAAMNGAKYVAPYVNRIDNISGDGTGVVADIVSMFEQHHIEAKVLAASFKNSRQLHEVILFGGHSATLPLDILMSAQAHQLTDWSLDQFKSDWESVYGEKTLVTTVK